MTASFGAHRAPLQPNQSTTAVTERLTLLGGPAILGTITKRYNNSMTTLLGRLALFVLPAILFTVSARGQGIIQFTNGIVFPGPVIPLPPPIIIFPPPPIFWPTTATVL